LTCLKHGRLNTPQTGSFTGRKPTGGRVFPQVYGARMETPDDPVGTNPDHYSVLFENERVRVLEYRDEPGDETTPHRHPDSVMVTLSAFRRRLSTNDRVFDAVLDAAEARWLPAQSHSGENTGDTPTRAIFIELKGPSLTPEASPLGPA